LQRQSDKSSFPAYFTYKNTTLNTPDAIANAFNDFYINIGPELANKGQPSSIDVINLMPQVNIQNSLFLAPSTPQEVLEIIDNMKPKCSSGTDNISPKLVKQTALQIAEPLSHIINISFRSGIVPSEMKIAKVLPFYKKDDPYQLKNYRPISLLPSFSKVLERAMYNRLYKFLKAHNLIDFKKPVWFSTKFIH